MEEGCLLTPENVNIRRAHLGQTSCLGTSCFPQWLIRRPKTGIQTSVPLSAAEILENHTGQNSKSYYLASVAHCSECQTISGETQA